MTFQEKVQEWMLVCFGPEVSADRLERADRFVEEVLELLQSVEYPRERIGALEDYVYSRPVGENNQELGGVMLTLAAFCESHGLFMQAAGEDELLRVWGKVEKIREKQAAKPHGSALPVATAAPQTGYDKALAEAIAERLRQIEAEGWSAEHDDSHAHGEMARAAAAYCLGQWELTGAVQDGKRFLPWRKLIWPWSKEWWKPKTRREDLIRAAALIIAEIERLDRSTLEGGEP